MNLTIALKNQLLKDVIFDQYGDSVSSLQKKLSDQLTKELLSADNGFSGKVIALAKKHGKPDQIATTQSARIHVVLSNTGLKFGGWISLSCTLVSLNTPCFDNTNISNDVLLIIEKAKELFNEIESVSNDLSVVLNSVKTVSKLQSITKVFDPFIPHKPSKSTQLVPTEPLLRINKLKSPKKQVTNHE